MKKVSDVLIRNQKYELLNIPGKTHTTNNKVSTLWIKKDKDIFNDEIEYIPWDDFNTNRDCWEVSIKQGNSMGLKYDSWDIKGHTYITISLNNMVVYEYPTYDLNIAFLKSQFLIDRLKSLPIKLDNLSKDDGRCIFYKKLPCILLYRTIIGKMVIKPDCDKEELNKWWEDFADPWYSDLEHELLEEWKEDNYIIVDILSDDIYWYRNDREIKINNINRKIKKGT